MNPALFALIVFGLIALFGVPMVLLSSLPSAKTPSEPHFNHPSMGTAKRLFTRWRSMHGAAANGHEEAWRALDEWERGYWYGMAEFVLENFDEKRPRQG